MKRAIRVLHIAPTVGLDDGISLAVVAMVRALDEQGVTATVLTGKYPASLVHPALLQDRTRTFDVRRVFGGTLGSNLLWPRDFGPLLRTLARTADVVHVHGMWLYPTILGCPILRRLRIPYVISPHGSLMIDALRRGWLKKRVALGLFERRNLSGSAAIVAASTPELNQLRSMGFSERALVVPLAIAPDALEFFSSGRSLEGYLARPVRTILCVSRFHSRKRLIELVRIFAGLAGDYPGWRLRIVGPDFERGYRHKVVAAAIRSGVGERMAIEPPLHGEALWRAYFDADLFVLPSTFENFGLVIGEALASGIPAITTQGAPWPQLTADRSGWWTDTSVASLRSAIAAAMATPPSELYAMGRRGATMVSREFSIQALGRRLNDLYASIVS